MKVVYAFVVLDLPHWGHVYLLKRAKELGNILVVGVLDCDTVETYKRKPIMSLEERMRMAYSLKWVDLVVPQFEKFPLETLKMLHRLFPDDKLICVHGDDWKPEGFKEVLEFLQSIDGELKLLPYYRGTNTTQIIEAIREGTVIQPHSIAQR